MLKLLLASALTALIFLPLPAAASTNRVELPPGEDAAVTRVIDGDTIEVRVNDTRFTVRYIGIDAPETRGAAATTCLSRQATAANRALVQGKTLRLERDTSEFDKYGRLLRYVYLPDGAMVNESLVKSGFAQTLTYPPDVKHAERLAAAQQQARSAGAGLWSKCPGLTVAESAGPVAPTAAAPVAAIAPATNANCDPSYPTICIPAGAADLDCPDIEFRRFQVLQPDPHRFDGDKDGIGCER